MSVPIVTGYYRYTDIWHEWSRVVPERHGQLLKATLAHDALTHQDHPLHVDGVEGAQLFIGTLHSGEQRLLFSSKQVDYIRYWLYAMKLTETEIPLPYSECLLLEGEGSDLRNVTTRVYKDGSHLHGALREIDKINKKLKGSNPSLVSRQINFRHVRRLFAEKKYVWLAIDIEAWEMDHSLITEFGWSALHWVEGKEVLEDGHWIVKEYETYRNGKYVPDNRTRYNFGQSEVLRKVDFKDKISKLFQKYRSLGALFLVFHDSTGDIKYLKSKMIEAPLDDICYLLSNASPDDGLFVVDTSDLFAALEGDGGHDRRGLAKACNLLGIDTKFLHNAGNDAHYTLMACKDMAEGEELEIQRERRWPNCIVQGSVKVNFLPHQEDSDYSDEEGLLG
ncbi:hypothetical protein E1B28_004262 [Marasmius oreades]|uniref:Gfd2/YDR514C-like C-terminal domain-containing protein n=1 Tax=Marasmius oreades TaxID=181124 RepID=A0A9P8ACT2_9AGAR|nr:uncharacterized protein E1B28_004262 [Marasmius oreades]KAG7096854.1 hypothetical protein E1B28_004262 [Marasmius oreades]